MESHDVRAWVMSGSVAGPSSRHADLVQAATEEPVIEAENRPAFDAEQFRARVLRISAARGNA